MAVYQFTCSQCGESTTKYYAMSGDIPVQQCPKCSSVMTKNIGSQVNFNKQAGLRISKVPHLVNVFGEVCEPVFTVHDKQRDQEQKEKNADSAKAVEEERAEKTYK